MEEYLPTIYEKITDPYYRDYNYYMDPNNLNKRYITLQQAIEKQTPTVADINDPSSGAFFSITPTMSKSGEGNATLKLAGEIVDPKRTWVEVDENNKVINIAGHNIITGGEDLIPTYENGYIWHPRIGWYKSEKPIDLIYDADDLNYANTARNVLMNSYWTTPGQEALARYSNPYTDQERLFLNLTTLGTNTAAGLTMGFAAPTLPAYGALPIGTSILGGYAGNELGHWAASQFTDNPYYQGLGGFAGMLLGGGLGYKAGTKFAPMTFELKIAQDFQRATGVNYWNPTSKLVGRYINGQIEEIPLIFNTLNYGVPTERATLIKRPLPSQSSKQPRYINVMSLQYPGQKMNLGYFGPKHSISEVVNPDGSVNWDAFVKIADEVAESYSGEPGVYKLSERLENPEWHKTDPNTLAHTKEVVLRALEMPVPEGYTKLDQVFTALSHDFGKMFAGEGHAEAGALILKLIFPDMTDAQYRAISLHMMSEDVAQMNFGDLPLLLATMEADRGEPLFKNQSTSNTIVYTGVPQKYVDNFENYNGEIWAGPTFESVLKYAKKLGNTFTVQYDPENVRIIEIDAQGRLSVKGARKTDVPSDILDLYNEAGIMESPAYMSLYNLSKFANKIGPTVIKVKNVKDSSGKVFDYTIIGENVPRKIIKKIKNPSRALYDINLSKIPLDLVYPTSEPNVFVDNKYHFITLNELDPGEFNKEWSYETIRRLNNLGYDTKEVTTYPMEYGTRVTSPSHYIIENDNKRLYLGYDPIYYNYSGFYRPRTDKRYLNLLFNKNIPSTVFHEQNMHGTDRLIELMEQYYGGKAKSMYTDVLDKMFKGVNTKDLSSRNSNKWYEFRATLGEVIRRIHYKFRKEGSIADNIGKFEAEVDNLSDSELLDMLNSINTYGADYAKILKTKPELMPEIKHLLKYAPAVLFGYGLNQNIQLNKQGNKLIRRNKKFRENFK